jgi:Zn ribbon nucleic-acid-binding protein
MKKVTEIDHNKRLSEVLSHAKCPRCNSNDKVATAYVGDNYNLKCKHCWYERTESWRPSMAKDIQLDQNHT